MVILVYLEIFLGVLGTLIWPNFCPSYSRLQNSKWITSVHLLTIKTQDTETADEGTGDDTSSTTALLESASLLCVCVCVCVCE